MAHSYTPGLKVAEKYHVKKRRILPIKGEVLVKVGDLVNPEEVVAKTELPGDVYPINIVNLLGVGPKEVPDKMLVKEGGKVSADQIFAKSTSFFGLFKNTVKAPVEATIEAVSTITGQVILRGNPLPVEVKGYIQGKVREVIEREGIVVECEATFIQGIFGIGHEQSGELVMAVKSPSEVLDEDKIKEAYKGKIIGGGGLATAAALKKAEEIGVKGIVVGGFDDRDLRDYLGYDLGVAITGSESIDITLVVTEGFGHIDMADRTFSLLKDNEGRLVSINGATQIRAGVIRPEVVIVSESQAEETAEIAAEQMVLEEGALVRCIRRPYFGRIGKIVALPSELVRMESETKVRVMEIEFDDGERVIVPRANVETIESR